ncbi:pleiotropic drug resistance ABC transporter [Sistotremastrum niveocremeum HHB9708]|uniref:Pleiotropic drug resistance ABC transporter n=1 Tax=Sistotremastrum niveocremeum HHB9708 TaxID=1314777 RepID=A0A164Y4F7_9AGAM|nr:pleiotropic drug resistance ABC transporter [Sistotremastrum niveocremeum HHB9708]
MASTSSPTDEAVPAIPTAAQAIPDALHHRIGDLTPVDERSRVPTPEPASDDRPHRQRTRPEHQHTIPQPQLSRVDSRAEHVPFDFFDQDGCADLVLQRQVTGASQRSSKKGRSRSRARSNASALHPARESIPEPVTHASSSSGASGAGTLVGEGAEEDFQFDGWLQTQWDAARGQGIECRQAGITFKDLRVVGLGATAKHQDTIFSILSPMRMLDFAKELRHPPKKDILTGFEGTVRPGEMLLVLGRPGSGCTSLLRTLANQRSGFHAVHGEVSYDGITPEYMAKHYRGDVGYSPEDDVHFPSLTVRQTLEVSAATRTPQTRIEGRTRQDFIDSVVETLATVFGLRHTYDTAVGDENIRGVSGGEKKRVSIAEMMSTRVCVACWDNSTRGLDASTALEFTRALRIATDIAHCTTIVTLYQASENIYSLFDKVCVLNEGRMAYFGPADQARAYFEDMGYVPANRQTTADFLVSVTDVLGRRIREGVDPASLPRTPDEFARHFKESPLGIKNASNVEAMFNDTELQEKTRIAYKQSARAEHSRHVRPSSPYTISIAMQVRTLMKRRVQIIRGDWAAQAIHTFNFLAQALIMGSVFFRMSVATADFFSRGAVLFFSVLFGALSAMAEIPALYAQRPIVARHQKAAMYRPFVESLALTVVDIPITFVTILIFDVVLYFMTGLSLHPASKFFVYLLFTVTLTLCMKAFFRALAASFKTESEAQAVAGLGVLALVLYTGFTIPKPSMIGALKWLTYINPIRYGFESLVANEFHGLDATCSNLVPSGPGYENAQLTNQVCTTVGSVPGQQTVSGDNFISLNYQYSYSHEWRNLGIVIAFWIGFLIWFFYATERAGLAAPGGTQLVFKRGAKSIEAVNASDSSADEEKGHTPPSSSSANSVVAESPEQSEKAKDALPDPRGVFSWHHLNFDVRLANGNMRRLLDDVSGYVVPGKLTALMGESGAGKTTLLNALAERSTVGVITGDRFVNGLALPKDFAAQTGYCQQMDIHLETATVREALRFSAVLRQPKSVSKAEKYAYVEDVIKMCAMETYADAIVGVVGEGLNVEQRKRLTIGVELAAKPQLLLFLDEPTSGLDSQSAWAIIDFLRSLADRGQAILCTIHQPSAELFQAFDRLLLLKKGGQTCYFGDLGENATTLIKYFEANGGRKCESTENPAEYMLDVIGAGATATSTINWHDAWVNSPERRATDARLAELLQQGERDRSNGANLNDGEHPEFAAPWGVQFWALLERSFQNYFRSPTYLLSKYVVNVFAGLFVGFTFFKAKNSLQGSQDQLFAVFMATITSVSLSNQLQVPFIRFRQIYEVREAASKMYHWIPLTITSVLVEIPFNIFGSSLFFFCWYWTVGFPGAADRIGYQFLAFVVYFTLYYTTFSQAVAAMAPNAQIAGLIFSFLFSFVITFNGVLQPFSQLTPFWHWMYRLSPFTYLIEALVTNGIGRQAIQCSSTETQIIVPPSGQTCAQYMSTYISNAGGYLSNPNDSSNCEFCSASTTDQYLVSLNMSYSHRWRNIGFLSAYIGFNIFLVFFCTYMFRVRKGSLFGGLKKLFKKRE